MDPRSNSNLPICHRVTNLQRMVTTGPRVPTHPVGPPREMSRNHWGAVIRHQEFEDGWLYEFSSPIGAHQSVFPRAKTVKLLFSGRWVDAFCEEEINYLTVWVPKEEHEEIFPDGPPAFRYYDEDAREAARLEYHAWLDPNETLPGGGKTAGLKAVERGHLGPEAES